MSTLQRLARRTALVVLTAVGLHAVPAQASFVIPINPTSTYLRTNFDAGATDAIAIDLSSLGIADGDLITIERLGTYSFDVIGIPNRPNDVKNLVAVFSDSPVLGASSDPIRVSAIAAIPFLPLVPWTTDPTYVGGLPTDVPEDFYAEFAAVYVPTGGKYLFVSPADSFFGDNGPIDGDYAVQITNYGSAIPEASSIALAGIGMVGMLTVIRRRRQR